MDGSDFRLYSTIVVNHSIGEFHYNFGNFEYYTRKEIYLFLVFLHFYSFGIARKLCDEQWLQFSKIDRSVAKSELGGFTDKSFVIRLGLVIKQ